MDRWIDLYEHEGMNGRMTKREQHSLRVNTFFLRLSLKKPNFEIGVNWGG